jgi:hypothetical protein
MQAQIIGVAQELSFVDGVTVNYMLLQLPNGREIRALVDTDEAAAVTAAFIQTGGAAAQQALSDAGQTTPLDPSEDPDFTVVPRQALQAERSPHPALSHISNDMSVAVATGKNYTPLRLDDEGNAEFGGDWEKDNVDNGPSVAEYEQSQGELAAVDRELQQAAHLVATAAGVSADDLDPAALRRAVAALQATAPTPLPQPSWGAALTSSPGTQPRRAPANRTALMIQADAKGNPIFSGANVADMRDLAGGNLDGEEADEVGSI